MIFNLGTDGEFYWEPEVYKNKKLPLRETPKELENVRSDPKMMNYNQLRKYISIIADVSPGAVKRLSVELHYKISFALTALVTVIIGVPFSISTGRVNTLVGMAKGIAIALLYIPCAAVVLSIGKGGGLPPVVAAWGCSAVFIAVGAWFITHKS
jgi:lipopolysaccharide export system permease protein